MLIEESSKINAIYKKYKDYEVIHSIYSFHCIFSSNFIYKYIFYIVSLYYEQFIDIQYQVICVANYSSYSIYVCNLNKELNMREFYKNMEWICEQSSSESDIRTLQLIKIQINAFPIISQSSLTYHWQVS